METFQTSIQAWISGHSLLTAAAALVVGFVAGLWLRGRFTRKKKD